MYRRLIGRVLYLGFTRPDICIAVTQTKYITDLIQDASITHAKTNTTPLPTGVKFTSEAGNPLTHPEMYRRLIGRVLYLGFTRPDICHAAQQLSQFMQSPCKQHLDAAIHLLRYLNGTVSKGLFFSSETSQKLLAYSDANWASCVDTKILLIFLFSLISWKTKKQHTVSRSTAEAEYRSMASTTCELVWVYNLLQDLQIQVPTPIPFLCGNQAALHIVANPVFHKRTKHLEIDCYLVRDKYKKVFLHLNM
ncbi:UNVERIFIED_CONTAM: Retrovirus-related Pol polyprotein from transposon RE1 [Sesamum radiatum]|uniref:Retrovirus-related Pol polyprotein from transposon RE1 n=1 Tax=Sesamum radiatum TaxID=300843 RepID=A0AAW2LKP3_SESRA